MHVPEYEILDYYYSCKNAPTKCVCMLALDRA